MDVGQLTILNHRLYMHILSPDFSHCIVISIDIAIDVLCNRDTTHYTR